MLIVIYIFEASKHCQNPQNASMQNKILRLTDTKKWLKKDKKAPKAWGFSSFASLS